MKAYKNSKGCIMAVFKNDSERYAIRSREDGKAYFKAATGVVYPHRKTRADAEADMADRVRKSKDKTWKPIEFRG